MAHQYQCLSPSSAVNELPWYWPNLTKEEAVDILMEHEHGDFLVRDSTTPGEYTLVVRKKQKVRNIRIHRGRHGYGVVSDSCDFAELATLIDHLQAHPALLHTLFPHIDLINPVCRPEETGEEETTYELLSQLVRKDKDYLQQQSSYSDHVQRRELTLKELQFCKTRITSLKTVASLFEDQLGLQSTELSCTLMKPAAAARTEEEEGLALNRTVVHGRIRTLRERVQEEEGRLRQLEATANEQLREIEMCHPQLVQKQQQLTLLRLRVEERGIDKDYLDLLLKEEKSTNLGHYNEEYWLVPDCDSRKAREKMAGRVPGTFLVRPSSQGGYALSMVCAKDDYEEVKHCMIYHSEEKNAYGFHPEYCIFSTLKELVIKHRTVSLKHYNRTLDVCLTYPVNYTLRLSDGEAAEEGEQ